MNARTIVIVGLATSAFAQDLHVTATALSVPTTRAMFGKLPKQIQAASVQVCNQGSDAVSVPLARVVQQVKLVGLTVLPRDAALVVVAQAQGRNGWASAFRWLGAGTGTVSTLTALKVIDANASWGSAIIFGTAIVSVAAQQFSGAVQTHSLLAITTEALPDPLQLPPVGCAQGVALIEQNQAAKSIDLTIQTEPEGVPIAIGVPK